jgi:hypothetical protein
LFRPIETNKATQGISVHLTIQLQLVDDHGDLMSDKTILGLDKGTDQLGEIGLSLEVSVMLPGLVFACSWSHLLNEQPGSACLKCTAKPTEAFVLGREISTRLPSVRFCQAKPPL